MNAPEQRKLEKVIALDKERAEKGFKQGWTYHRCKKLGLLTELRLLQKQGVIANGYSKPYQPDKLPSKLLTIELVPETCWFSNVRSNVNPDQWDMLKKRTFKAAKYRCEVCGGKGPKWPVECHEIWHYDDERHIQKLTGLIALCPSCHEVKHMGLANKKGRSKIAMNHLSRVNSWSQDQTDRYVKEQFDLWLRRSEHGWSLDVSWLEQHGIFVARRDREQEVSSEDMIQWLTKGKPAGTYSAFSSESYGLSESSESIGSVRKPGLFRRAISWLTGRT